MLPTGMPPTKRGTKVTSVTGNARPSLPGLQRQLTVNS